MNFISKSEEIISKAATKNLFICIHGYGQTEKYMFNKFAKPISTHLPEASFLCPCAPYKSVDYPGGYNWINSNSRLPKNLYELALDSCEHINKYIDESLQRFNISDNKLFLVGFSQGSRLITHIAPRRSNACRGVICFSSTISKPELLQAELKSRPDFCIIQGKKDEIITIAQQEIAKTALTNSGINVDITIIEELGHRIDHYAIDAARKFIESRIAK